MEKTRNAIAVININRDKLFKICEKTLEEYCKNYKIALEIITEKKFDINGIDTTYNYLTFEKNQIYDLFNKYDRILRLDADILITSHCPNLFEIVPIDKIGIVFEDIGPKRKERRKVIKEIQNELGSVGWKTGYFNSGVILASEEHKEIFNLDHRIIEVIKNLKTRYAKEQTFLNYKIRDLGFELFELDFKFNHILKIFNGPWIGNPNRYDSFIIHYAGNQKIKLRNMKSDFKKLWEKKRI